ncbi:MAG: TonB family protein [Candidatus Babeliales bacterium]
MPNKKGKRRKNLTLFFIWSLLIHLIIIIIFFLYAFKKREILLLFTPKDQKTHKKFSAPKKETIVWFKKDELKEKFIKKPEIKKVEEKLKQIEEKNELPASLKPRRSEFGVTEVFDEIPQFRPPQAKILAKQEQAEIKTETKQKAQIKQHELKQKQQTKTETKQEVTEKIAPETNIDKKAVSEKPGIKEFGQKELQEKIKQIEQKQLVVAKAMAQQEKLEKEIDLPKVKTESEQVEQAGQVSKTGTPGQQDTEQLRTFGHDLEDKGPIQKPKKSIIAMTRGFIENLKNEGTDWLERKGDDNKRPTFEEMKYISYEQQVNWHLQNSWKQNFEYRPWQKVLEGKAVVEFKITDKGNVQDVKLLESTGIMELDEIIIKSVHLATPFPPLPKHFNTNLYTTGRIIHVNARRIGL